MSASFVCIGSSRSVRGAVASLLAGSAFGLLGRSLRSLLERGFAASGEKTIKLRVALLSLGSSRFAPCWSGLWPSGAFAALSGGARLCRFWRKDSLTERRFAASRRPIAHPSRERSERSRSRQGLRSRRPKAAPAVSNANAPAVSNANAPSVSKANAPEAGKACAPEGRRPLQQ